MKHALFDMFLFLFRSKYRRKRITPTMTTKAVTNFALLLAVGLVFGLASVAQCSPDLCKDVECGNGVCQNGTCLCNDGWQGSQCQYCGGKVKLNGTSGFISDGIGNYSLDVKCSWLIEAGNSTNSTIRLHFEEFITECGWDHLYIYDGDSVHSPLLGVYSGLMYSKDYSLQSVPEIVAHSGFALLHFYSDIAYNLSGFNISYSLNTCPSTTSSKECSGNGACVESVCTCDAQFTGEACHIPICPNKCTASNGVCDQEQHRCICHTKYKGDDCSQVAEHGYWEVLKTSDFVPQGSASHTAVVWQDSMYIVGGESFKKGHMLYVYDFNGHVWETPHVISKTSPTIRYGHSSVLFGDKIYVYGGVKEDGIVCNELWAYDISAKSWENVTVNTGSCERNLMSIGFTNQALCGPLRSAGHTATLVPPSYVSQSTSSGSGSKYVTERMIIIFGHSPTYGFLNFVQEYYFGTREWAVVKTKGYPVKGGYGHSAAWDPVTERILVYGGYVSMSPLQSALSSKLYAYDPYSHTWYLMSDGPSGRFLHSGSMLSPSGGLMLIYGGNIHNDTGISLVSSGGQCYTAQPLLYDTYCDSWTQMALPSNLFTSLMRFGHSAITFEKSMYLYGGFNGQMLNDILKFSPGNCSSNNMITSCLNSRHFGVKCVWDNEKAICLPFSEIPIIPLSIDFESTYSRCPEESKSQVTGIIDQCKRQISCEACVHTHRCGWCPLSNSCVHDIEQCTTMNRDDIPYRSERPITSGYQCTNENADHMRCNHLHSCQYCVTHTGCHWNSKVEIPICVPITNKSMIQDFTSPDVCESVCDHYTECTNCTKDECIWCQNNERCIDKNAYTSSFPYGQCREWTTDEHRCRTSPGNSQCNYYKTCTDCRDDPECGWCDDGSGTGLGSCMAGGNTPPQSCSQNKWYFTHCPTCQCNGHSTCMNNTDVCIHPCSNNTEGQNCEACIKGFYGNPVNGGECKECRCNNQGNHCNQENGKCYCTTKGIIGDNCEKCDTNNHYLGDPSNYGSCFYDLTIDYQFTFNLSKKDDLRFTQINFQNSPSKSDVDADFSITCSVMAKMNITVRPEYQPSGTYLIEYHILMFIASGPEKMLLPLQNCTNFRTKFLKSEYMFGTGDNMSLTTFYVYVYDFKPPLWIQISFSQYPKLNLQQFFITFSSCFLLLLLVAAILWKLKQKYDMYRRRQRMFVEMEQMASRPFSVVEVEIEKRNTVHGNQIPTISVSSNLRKRKIDVPNPVALEPCAGNRAAVLTLLVRQPTGNDKFTPHSYSGLAIASALVVVGNVQHSKTNGIDNGSSPLPGKEDVRWTGRGLKASQHPSEARI